MGTFRTSNRTAVPQLVLLGREKANPMIHVDFLQFWRFLTADIHSLVATGVEMTNFRGIDGTGHVAGEKCSLAVQLCPPSSRP